MDDKTAKVIADTIKNLEKEHGKGIVMKIGDKPLVQVEIISSGSFSLDAALGIGGFPRGRIIEFYGPEQGGKTSASLVTIAQAQKAGLACAFIDAEHALDLDWARLLGVNTDELYVSQPSNGEQALEIADELIASHAFGVVVIDSVAALVPQAELEGNYGDAQMANQARLMSQAMRKLTGLVARSNTSLIFINQLRHKIGGYGNPETTTGGNALKFYASIRVDVRKGESLKKGEEIIGHKINIKIIKNKLAPPFKKAVISFYYDRGYDNLADMIPEAVRFDIIEKSGSWYSYKEERLGQGAENAIVMLKENPKICDEIVLATKKALGIIKEEPKKRELKKATKDKAKPDGKEKQSS